MNKENYGPRKKQGIQYEISTGKKQGVYLSQDIADDNYLSLSLLTKEAQSSHKSFVNTLQALAKQPENQAWGSKNQSEVDSFNQNFKFLSKKLEKVGEEIHSCAAINRKARQELDSLRENIQSQNLHLQHSVLPAFKGLRDKIKQNKLEQTATYSKIKRELDSVQQCLGVVGKGIRQCERKMDVSEHLFGGRQHLLD